MPTASSSRFVSLTSYCVVEYMFEPLGSLDYYTDSFYLLRNSNTGTNQIYNTDVSVNTTANIKDLTVTETPNGRFAYLDSEIIPNYTDYDQYLTETIISGNNVVMDKVRFHFVSGFDFNDFEALILSIVHLQNDGESNIFANILLSPTTYLTLMTFNDKPLFLSNALYDRYVDFWVPSIKNINEEYQIAPVQANTFAAEITPSGANYCGLVYNNPLSIKLLVSNKKHTLYTSVNVEYETFEVNQVFEATLSQSNEFDGVGAVIQEAANGDFIEFFMTYNSAFPEELISMLNKRNPANDWIIIHQLSIFEQVGTNFIPTARQVFFQEDSFDEPNLFRPVLKFANEAATVSIDYLVRLTNKLNGDQIIREASSILTNPKKYGKSLTTIPLSDPPTSHMVYNKIIKKDFEASKLFVEPIPIADRPIPTVAPGEAVAPSVITKTEYVPIFFSNNKVSVSNTSAMVTAANGLQEIVFGPNSLKFIFSPFDNFLKFKFYTEYNSTSNATKTSSIIPLDLNITNVIFRMIFETDAGKVLVDNMNSAQFENPSAGEIAFKVAKKDSETIISSSNRTIYFVTVAQDGTETVLYTGQWRKPSEQSEVDAAIAAAQAEADTRNQIDTKLNEINEKIKSLTAKYDKNKAGTTDATSSVKEVGSAPAVNKFGVTNASKIRTNSNNAGK